MGAAIILIGLIGVEDFRWRLAVFLAVRTTGDDLIARRKTNQKGSLSTSANSLLERHFALFLPFSCTQLRSRAANRGIFRVVAFVNVYGLRCTIQRLVARRGNRRQIALVPATNQEVARSSRAGRTNRQRGQIACASPLASQRLAHRVPGLPSLRADRRDSYSAARFVHGNDRAFVQL
jgi:hypothetical protein